MSGSVTESLLLVDIRPYLYGGTAAMVAETTTFPLDTAKVRMQLQGCTRADARFAVSQYRGTAHCIRQVSQVEGWTCLYHGLAPALLRQAVYGSIKYGVYYSVKEHLAFSFSVEGESLLLNLFCGVFAGSLSSAIANPTDVLKVRMQARNVETNGKNMIHIARDIFRQEGVTGLWRGVSPTSQRSGLVAGVQLPVYDLTKYQLVRQRVMQDGAWCHLVSSILAGFTAALASNPVDVIRTRMMIQRRLKEQGEQLNYYYRSTVECGAHTVKTEGFSALFKGFVPAFTRMGPWNIIFFLVYEKLKLLK